MSLKTLAVTIFVSAFTFLAAQDAPIPVVGSKAPFFSVQSLEYNNFVLVEKLAELKKTKGFLVLDFWATWCKPCMRELPAFEKIHKELAAKGFHFYAVAIDDKRQDIWKFIKTDKKFTFPVLVDLNAYQAGRKYGADRTLPQIFVIDSDGVVRWQHTGEIKNMEEALKGVLEGLKPGSFPAQKGVQIQTGDSATH